VIRPPTTSAGDTVYGISGLISLLIESSHPKRPELPPMQGTFPSIVCTTPSGVVSLNVPPENAQIESRSFAFWRVAR
jgi:hypothetical protein